MKSVFSLTLLTLSALLTSTVACDGLFSWKGIKYAAADRFSPPSSPIPYNADIPTVAYGDICYQDPTNIKLTGQNVTMSEDCLHLNVFRPDDANSTELPLPVMVWIHGGGFTQGWSQQMDVTQLAKNKRVVTVSINYRLGAFGFFPHPDISAATNSTGGMHGIMDQIAALQWVQENIDQFGGDPNQVTVFGESAGGLSVCYLLSSPKANNLFQNAIIESGPCQGPWGMEESIDAAYAASETFMKEVMGGITFDEMRTMDAETLMLDLHGDAAAIISRDDYLFTNELPITRISNGDINLPSDGSLISGCNTVDTLTMEPWDLIDGTAVPDTVDELEAAVKAMFPGHEEAVLSQYDVEAKFSGNATHAFQQINADICVICPTKALNEVFSAHVPTYSYQFAGVSDDGRASHGSELCFLFVDVETNGELCSAIMMQNFDEGVADTMQSYWSSFAKTNAPAPKDGDVEWPKCSGVDCEHLKISGKTEIGTGMSKDSCDFWNNEDISATDLKLACLGSMLK
jgi:para-nitrobenzyl esterase